MLQLAISPIGELSQKNREKTTLLTLLFNLIRNLKPTPHRDRGPILQTGKDRKDCRQFAVLVQRSAFSGEP
jgi:hypothetical protein